MRILIYTVLSVIIIALAGCEKMDENYAKYLEDEIVYSPRVSELKVVSGLREVTLTWNNPEGNVAKGIFIDYLDDTIRVESMIDSIFITGLQIKGYDISVYTFDTFNNLSIPSTVTVFPNGEDQN